MNVRKKQKIKMTLILLTILLPAAAISMNLLKQGNLVNKGTTAIDEDIGNIEIDKIDSFFPNTADITHVNEKYDLSLWWNKTYRFRIGFVIEETEGIDRYQPLDVFFSFKEDEHYEDTERLLSFNATGSNEWSNPIPMQVWNVTKFGATNYIQSCTITFIADVMAGTNQTYFLYYNENDADIEMINYNTNLTSDLSAGTLTVTVGTEYQAVLNQGLAATELVRQGLDFHLDDSLSPEKQLADPSLKFLAHFENSYSDSTGNEPDGTPNGDPTFTNGIVRSGVDFDGNDFVSYANGLEDTDDPFNDLSTEFTLCAWINPSSISGGATNHQTENVIAAKASDPYNDNFEVGVNNEGNIHVYLDTESRDTYADFGPAGSITTIGGWYFVAFRYDSGTAEVRIDDTWYSSTVWSGASDIDQAVGSPFTIGASEHINQYFKGAIDEVAVYNKYLSNQEVEDFKFGSMPSTIQTITELENGEVFSRYQIDWTTAFDMHVQDICTFYYDYSLWSIDRSIYFENEFNYTTDLMFALNTNFDFSVVDDHNELLYIYDGNLQVDITTAGFPAENYTIVHNAPDPSKDAIGIFIEGYELSDPIHTSISYFGGDVIYDGGTIEFLPGSLNDFDNSVGNESYQLTIEFWELAGSVNSTGTLDNSEMIQYFDDLLLTLREDPNAYIYQTDSLFYTLDVNVTDIDGNLVPDATVTVWNATDYGVNWEQDTDEDGSTIFDRLENGVYDVNVSYVKFGKTLSITTAQTVELNETNVDINGVYKLEFTEVNLTSLFLTLNRFNDTAQNNYKGRINGAKLTFWRDSGSGAELLGSDIADENGELTFRWLNFTKPQDGNITFAIEWFEIPSTNVVALGDLDILNVVNTTFYFHVANSSVVNATFGSSFETNLHLYIFPDPDYNQMLGDTLNFQINLTYVENETIFFAMDGASVTYNIFAGVQQINTQTLVFSALGGGLYSLAIDTSVPIEPGVDWLSDNDYLVEITATKAGFITEKVSTSFILDPKTSTLIGNETEITAYWGELMIMDVVYTDISFGGSNPIEDATVDYSVIGVPAVTGSLTPYGSGGRYQFSVDTTVLPSSDSYIVQITANKQNYQEMSIFVDLYILAIKSLINDSVGIYKTLDLPFREERIFYFTYEEESSGLGLVGSELKTYEWTKEVGGSIVDSGAGSLIDLGNGDYSLDFDTKSKEIGIYTIIFNIEKENYAQRGGILILNVIPREFDIALSQDFNGIIISTVSGETLIFTLELTDRINGSSITGAAVSLTIQGDSIDFTDLGNGNYSISVSASKLPDAFFLPETIPGKITISNMYYSSKELDITIEVKMVEIFPGFPMFYFLMIVGAIVAVVGSLVVSRQIRRARIPTFVNKTREMTKNIKGRKAISDSLLYPSKEEYIIKKLGDKWEMLDLSLEEILGHSPKKKDIPKTEFEGGGI